MSVYDPQLDNHLPDSQNINCDGDCGTVATGALKEEMYEVAGACPAELLGHSVHFPVISHTIACVDKGTAIKGAWSERDQQCVVYFDTLWHLNRDEDGNVIGAPPWNWWYIAEWEVIWAST